MNWSKGLGNSEYHTLHLLRIYMYTYICIHVYSTLCRLHNILSLSLYTAPVIGTVAAEALSLSDVQVTVTLSDTGGQPVEEYTVNFVNDL